MLQVARHNKSSLAFFLLMICDISGSPTIVDLYCFFMLPLLIQTWVIIEWTISKSVMYLFFSLSLDRMESWQHESVL